MREKDDLKPSTLIGCISGTLDLFVILPIWYVLLFGVLYRTEAPPWQWVLFWVYVPAGIISKIIAEFAKTVARQGD